MTTVLEAAHLSKTFGAHQVLTDVSFGLKRGETLGVLGESGSGKSTLAKLILRLEQADSGTVTLDGRDFLGLAPAPLRAARRLVQLVPQNARNALNPTMTVRQNLRFHLKAQGIPAAHGDELIDGTLKRVAIAPVVLDFMPDQLSGGQAQRIVIARALSASPQVLVCDEPVAALDKSVQAVVLNTLAHLQADSDFSMIFISHDLAVIEHMSDSLIVLDGGRIVDQGTTRSVLDHPTSAFTQRLLAARGTAPGGSIPLTPRSAHFDIEEHH